MTYPVMYTVSVFVAEDEDEGSSYESVIRVVVPGGESHEIKANWTVSGRRQRLFNCLKGIPIREVGTVVLELLLNGEHVAQHIVDVEEEPDTPQPSI